MKYFFCKLIPPRPTFPQDATPAEMNLMREHSAYWRGLMTQGYAVVFGPVMDPAGAFGIGILELPDPIDPTALTNADPTILAQQGFRFEIRPMMSAVHRGNTGGA